MFFLIFTLKKGTALYKILPIKNYIYAIKIIEILVDGLGNVYSFNFTIFIRNMLTVNVIYKLCTMYIELQK